MFGRYEYDAIIVIALGLKYIYSVILAFRQNVFQNAVFGLVVFVESFLTQFTAGQGAARPAVQSSASLRGVSVCRTEDLTSTREMTSSEDTGDDSDEFVVGAKSHPAHLDRISIKVYFRVHRIRST